MFVTGLGFAQGCLPSIAFGIEENNAIIIDNGDIKKISESNTENGIYIFNIDNNIGEK